MDDHTPRLVRAWHGTRRRFSRFDPERSETEYGCFFADTPEAAVLYADGEGGRIVPVELRIERPFVTTIADWGAGVSPDPRRLADEGLHDGCRIEGMDGTSFVVWDPDAIHVAGPEILHGTPAFERLREVAVELGYVEDDPIAVLLR